MILYPQDYFKSVTEITKEYLNKKKIQALILDVDNTLIDYNENLSEMIVEWVAQLKKQDIKMFIVSNSNKKNKIESVANKLKIDYTFLAMKPFKKGLREAQKKLGLPNNNIAVVGDQIFTDVLGANRMKMYSILVEPIEKKDMWMTLLKRPLENYIKKRYFYTKEEK